MQVLPPKLPEGAKTTNDETRVKQHFAEEDTEWVRAQALRVSDFPLLLQRYPLLAEQQPMRRSSSHTDIYQIGIDARERTRTHGKVLPPPPPLHQQLHAEGEKQEQFEQRGKRWQADGSSGPPTCPPTP